MNAIVSIGFDRFFYCPKRENFLNNLIDRWRGVSFGFKDKDPKDIAFYDGLSDEQKETFKAKLLKAMDLRNEIVSRRKKAIKESEEYKFMNGLENTFRI